MATPYSTTSPYTWGQISPDQSSALLKAIQGSQGATAVNPNDPFASSHNTGPAVQMNGGGEVGFGYAAAPVAPTTKPPSLSDFAPSPYTSALQGMISGIPGSNYKAKDMSGTKLPEYDAIRSRLDTQYNQTQQQSQDAIDRQFAAMGGGPSGAQVKQTENLAGSIAKQKGADLDTLNAEEAQARSGLQEEERQKEFQSSESGRQLGFNGGMGLAGLDLAWRQAQAELQNNEFNKALATYQAKHSGGLLGGGGVLGSGIGA